MATDSDTLDDIFSDDVVKNARPAGKFQPRSKVGPKKKKPAATSVSSSRPVQTVDTTERESNEPVGTGKLLEDESAVTPSEAVTRDTCTTDNSEGTFSIPALSSVEGSAMSPEFEDADPLTDRECIRSRSDGGVSMDNKELEGEEIDVMDSIDFSELITTTVQKTGKFKPKVKAPSLKEMHVDSQPRPPENDYAEGNSVPAFLDDDILDLSSIGFSPSVPIEPTSEFPSNEESMNPMEMTDSGICSEGGPKIPAKLASRRAETGRSEALKASDPLQGNGSDRVLRPQKNKGSLCEVVDDAEDVVYASGEFSDRQNINDEQVQQDGASEVKKGKRKSKKIEKNYEERTKKQKKAKEASNQNVEAKPKKFAHTTRRKRVVDKVLLETPEDEIDYRKVPIRDLILLADHNERQTKREAPAAPAIKQSNGNSSSANNDDDEDFRSGEFGEDDDGEPDEESNMLINYQTYMKKTPTIRWSKQDTELFYQGVRQFGTDLSMIQHLFPGRTRQQVKLKYKKEERQHRLRLNEALTSRTKDHSHFKMVIERLKKIAAEEKLNAEGDDEPVDLTVGEEEETLNANDETAKSEKAVEEGNEDVEATVDVEVNEKAYDSEDDSSLWGQYKSAV